MKVGISSMLGNFQSSNLRIEMSASQTAIRDSLMRPESLRQWLWPQRLSDGLPLVLESGLSFTSWIGPVAIAHHVEAVFLERHETIGTNASQGTQIAESNCLRTLLSQGIDGFHEWMWGEGWVQSRLEGITLLPLNLAHTLSLLRLRQFLTTEKTEL